MHFIVRGRSIVKRRTLIWVAALNFAVAGAGCSAARGNERAADEKDSGSADTVTVSGCLSSGADGRFALTAAPDAAVAAAAQATALDPDRDTNAYVLIGGDNLQSHVGKRVEVIGTLQGHKQDVEQHDTKKTESASAVGGKDTPTVKTKESVDLEVRQLNVRQVRDVAPTCSVTP
jgi:hypothetical protein